MPRKTIHTATYDVKRTTTVVAQHASTRKITKDPPVADYVTTVRHNDACFDIIGDPKAKLVMVDACMPKWVADLLLNVWRGCNW